MPCSHGVWWSSQAAVRPPHFCLPLNLTLLQGRPCGLDLCMFLAFIVAQRAISLKFREKTQINIVLVKTFNFYFLTIAAKLFTHAFILSFKIFIQQNVCIALPTETQKLRKQAQFLHQQSLHPRGRRETRVSVTDKERSLKIGLKDIWERIGMVHAFNKYSHVPSMWQALPDAGHPTMKMPEALLPWGPDQWGAQQQTT